MAGVRMITGTDVSLRFETKEEWEKYERAIFEVQKAHYLQARERYGIWASNQGKYVKDISEFNQHDSKSNERKYVR